MLLYLVPPGGEAQQRRAEACPRQGETVGLESGSVFRVRLVVWSVDPEGRLAPTVSLEAL